MNDLRRITITTMVGLAVFAQLMIPTPVRADGEVTPPPSEIPVQTATPEPTEVLPTEPPTADPALLTPIPATEVASDVAPIVSPEEAARATAPAEEKKATRETGLSEMLRQLPADTSVKVLDENGQAFPLVSQAAADAIAQSDPIWCPNGVAPVPGVNGCTGIFFLPQPATLTELLSLFGPYINAQNVDGTIWITSGTVGEPGPVTIDGSFYSNWANHGLNLQGGWSGTYGDTTIGTNSVFSVPITVANWNNTLFIGNITISPPSALNINNPNQVVILADVNANNVNIDHAKGRIDVYNSTGNLNITNADINNNGLYSSGINIHTLNGNVTISDSAFHENGYDGIWMDTVNNVAINNSLFYNNNSHGAGIYNSGNISINGSAFYQNSNGNGIDLFNVNDVAIDNNSLFYNNANHGAGIYHAANISINSSTFYQNGNQGADLYNVNDLTIDNSQFHDNANHGLFTYNAGNIFINNGSSFYQNGNDGINLYSVNDITVNNGTFNGNSGMGASIDTAGSITLNDSLFDGNQADGASMTSSGNVALNNTDSTGNSGTGVSISDASGVQIATGVFSGNVGGIYVTSSSNTDVTLDQVTIDGSLGFGLGIETNGGNVNVSNSSVTNTVSNDNNPIFPWGDGADLFTSGGSVTLTQSQFTGNAFDGVFAVVDGGNIVADHSAFNGNGIGGLDTSNANQVEVIESEFTANGPYYDLFASCYKPGPPEYSNSLSLFFDDVIPVGQAPTFVSILVDSDCLFSNYSLRSGNTVVTSLDSLKPGKDRKAKKILDSARHVNIPSESHVELFLCWDNQESHRINLPNGDKVEIICEVHGKASISRLDNTTLPGELPAGYTFASAFQVEISQLVHGSGADRSPIKVITEGGFIKASFVAPSIQAGGTYSILYWDDDTKTWIPLKDFLLGANGLPQEFSLHPENPNDLRQVLSGVELVSKVDPPRVEVSTNFPGIFVLASD